jgi:hypothetical protein
LFAIVGKVTVIKLAVLEITPDRVQLIVDVTGQGRVCVIVSVNGSFIKVRYIPTALVTVKRPSVLAPLVVMVVEA